MSDLEIRGARTADEAAVLALAREEMQAHEKLDPRFRLRPDAADRYAVYLRNRMRDLDSTVFVALEESRVAGIAVGSVRTQDTLFEVRRFGYVSDLVVRGAMRRRGVGTALYERIARWFRGLGLDVVRVHVAARSPEASAFWGSVGAEDFLTEAWIDLLPEPRPARPDVVVGKDLT